MTVIRFTIPGPPRAQGRPRFAKGRAYKDAASRENEATIAVLAQQAMGGLPPIEGPCQLVMEAVYPIAPSWPKKRREAAMNGEELPTRKPDVDNLIKAVADGMNGIAYADDAQITAVVMSKRYGGPAAVGVHVTVRAI